MRKVGWQWKIILFLMFAGLFCPVKVHAEETGSYLSELSDEMDYGKLDTFLENYGVVKCTEQDYKAMDKTHVTAVRSSRFSYEVMIDNKNEFIWQNKNLIVDNTTLEEIILFKVKGGMI